jgi:predicted nucleic-acid-binding Zn-ribbon protein
MAGADIREGRCPVCGHNEVVEAEPLEFGARGTSDRMAVAYDGKDGVMGFQPRKDQPFGALRSYTCRSCGLTQWYADAPETIPIAQNQGTRLIRGR